MIVIFNPVFSYKYKGFAAAVPAPRTVYECLLILYVKNRRIPT